MFRYLIRLAIIVRDNYYCNIRIRNWRHIFIQRNKTIKDASLTLTSLEKEEIKLYYKKYGLKALPIFHQFYKYCTGIFDVRYIPDDLYYSYIDPYYNNWALAEYLDNKTFYHLLFRDMRQPNLIAYRQNGYWFDKNHEIISLDSVMGLITTQKEGKDCFLKQATNSEGGKGVYVLNSNNSIDEIRTIIVRIKEDIVIQEGVKQSKILSKLNSSSVNTLRLLTLLKKDNSVHLCSTSLRMGVNGAKVDNASSGGITIGVNTDGSLKNVAYSASGEKYDFHPTSKTRFSSLVIPNYNAIVEIIKEQAKKNPHFRLISWDIAINENDEPVLIEANLRYGELEFHQLNNGPIFGDETESILRVCLNLNQIKHYEA